MFNNANRFFSDFKRSAKELGKYLTPKRILGQNIAEVGQQAADITKKADYGNERQNAFMREAVPRYMEASTQAPGAIVSGASHGLFNPNKDVKTQYGTTHATNFLSSMYGFGKGPGRLYYKPVEGAVEGAAAKVLGNKAGALAGKTVGALAAELASSAPVAALESKLEGKPFISSTPGQFNVPFTNKKLFDTPFSGTYPENVQMGLGARAILGTGGKALNQVNNLMQKNAPGYFNPRAKVNTNSRLLRTNLNTIDENDRKLMEAFVDYSRRNPQGALSQTDNAQTRKIMELFDIDPNATNRSVGNMFQKILEADDALKRQSGAIDFNAKVGRGDAQPTKGDMGLLEEARKYKSAEEFINSYNLYHGTPYEIEGGKLKFGGGKQLKKGGYMGGHFLTNEPDIANTFAFGGRVYHASGDIKNKVLDVNKNKFEFAKFIGQKYKVDGEWVTFTKNDFDFMFPKNEKGIGTADWSTVNVDAAQAIGEKMGKIGVAIPEYAGGKQGITYQLWKDNIPVYTKEQLSNIWKQAQSLPQPTKGDMAQKTFIHETNAPIKKIEDFDVSKMGSGQGDAWLGRGIYLQEQGSFKIESYGRNKIPAKLKPDAKVFVIEDTPKGKFRDNFVEWAVDKGFAKDLVEERVKEGLSLNNILPRDILRNQSIDDPIIKALRKEGYDALLQDGELVVYNPKAITSPLPQPTKGDIRAYHGTNAAFDQFDNSKILGNENRPDQLGHWFTLDKKMAKTFGKNVIEADLGLKNPKEITWGEWNVIAPKRGAENGFAQYRQELINQGYDGLHIKGQNGVADQYAVFDSKNITTPQPTKGDTTPKIGKVVNHDYMVKAGADGSFDKAVEAEIPLSKITGREPAPSMESYRPGREIKAPIELEFNPKTGEYSVFSGNHRIIQAERNGQETIKAFVKPSDGDFTLTPKIETEPSGLQAELDAAIKGNEQYKSLTGEDSSVIMKNIERLKKQIGQSSLPQPTKGKSYELFNPNKRTVYRATDSTNKGTTLGKGTYFDFNKDFAKTFGNKVEQYSLSPKAKMLNLREQAKLQQYTDEAIMANQSLFNRLMKEKGADEAIGEILRRYTKSLGYDGIVSDTLGSVVWNKRLLKKL